jgi:Homeodomain-like domain
VSPDPRTIVDPLERQRVALVYLEDAREEWKRQAKHWAGVRAHAVQELKQGRTWAQVAELLGVSEATAWNIAHPK